MPDASKGPNSKCQCFGVRKGLLIQKAGASEGGGSNPQICLLKYRVQASLMLRDRKMGEAVFVKAQVPSRIPLVSINLKAMGTMKA